MKCREWGVPPSVYYIGLVARSRPRACARADFIMQRRNAVGLSTWWYFVEPPFPPHHAKTDMHVMSFANLTATLADAKHRTTGLCYCYCYCSFATVQVDDVYLKILQMRDVRHRAVWPTMALCAALVATYLVLGARECRGGGRNSGARLPVPALVAEDRDDDFVASLRGRSKGRGCCDKRGRFLRFSTFLLAFLVWMTAAGSVTLSGQCYSRKVSRTCVRARVIVLSQNTACLPRSLVFLVSMG